jgi:hypothetical protein
MDALLFDLIGSRSAPMAAPAPPERRFPRGASGLFAGSSRSARPATRCRPLPCEETRRRKLRRHGPSFEAVQVNAGRTGATLRITVHDKPEASTFQLQGRLVGPWVRVLEECWQSTLTGRRDTAVLLDLTAVTFIDAAGKACLTARHQGAKFIAADDLTNAVVAEITQTPAPDCGHPK